MQWEERVCVDSVDLDTLEAFLLAGVREASPPRAWADRQTLAGGLHQALHLLPHQGGEAQAPLGDQPPHLHLDGEEVLVPGLRHGHVQPLGLRRLTSNSGDLPCKGRTFGTKTTKKAMNSNKLIIGRY